MIIADAISRIPRMRIGCRYTRVHADIGIGPDLSAQVLCSLGAALQFIRVRHHLFLRERDADWTYDITTAEAEAAFPWLHEYWDTFGRFFARPPGGESLAEVAARCICFRECFFAIDRSSASSS